MKILVLVSQTQDTEAKIHVSSGGDSIDTSGMKWIMNPYDEFAVEEAIQTKEKHGGEVVIVSVGPDRVLETIRQALAMGADSAVHIKGDGFAEIQVPPMQFKNKSNRQPANLQLHQSRCTMP